MKAKSVLVVPCGIMKLVVNRADTLPTELLGKIVETLLTVKIN